MRASIVWKDTTICPAIGLWSLSERQHQNLSLLVNWSIYNRFKQYICVQAKNIKKKLFSDCLYITFPVFMCPLHIHIHMVTGSRGISFEAFSLNAVNQFLGKAKHIKIICLHLKRISTQIIQWIKGFRFFCIQEHLTPIPRWQNTTNMALLQISVLEILAFKWS